MVDLFRNPKPRREQIRSPVLENRGAVNRHTQQLVSRNASSLIMTRAVTVTQIKRTMPHPVLWSTFVKG
jgi:hypothetical protein